MALGVLAWLSAAFETLVLKLAAEVQPSLRVMLCACGFTKKRKALRACFSILMLSLLGFEQLSLVAVALAAVVGDIVTTSCLLCRLSGGPRSVSLHTANASTACRLVKLSCSARAASLVAVAPAADAGDSVATSTPPFQTSSSSSSSSGRTQAEDTG